MSNKRILDIYHGDGIKTYDEVCNSVEFIVHKATEGRTYVDNKCLKRCMEFEKRKTPYWLYCFLQKGDEIDQVRFMLKEFGDFVANKKYFIGWVMDIEKDNNQKDVITAYKYLLDYCKKHNHKLMIYYMYSAYGKYASLINISTNDRDITGIWEARYTSKYKPHADVDLWQYTEEGSCPGITTKCDLNRIYSGHDLAWYKTKYVKVKKGYSGTFPILPDESFGVSRKYYQIGDGYETLKNYPTQIKRIQELLKWAGFYMGEINGKYTSAVATATMSCQARFDLPVNGKFGSLCLDVLKSYKK